MIHFTSSIVRCFNESILDVFLTFFLKCLYTLKISLTNHYNIYGRFFWKNWKKHFSQYLSKFFLLYTLSNLLFSTRQSFFNILLVILLLPPPLALFHSPFSNPPPPPCLFPFCLEKFLLLAVYSSIGVYV